MDNAELIALAEKCGAEQCGMVGEFLGFSSVEQLQAFAAALAREQEAQPAPMGLSTSADRHFYEEGFKAGQRAAQPSIHEAEEAAAWAKRNAQWQAAQPPKWIDDPHDIDQAVVDPAWLKLHGLTAATAPRDERAAQPAAQEPSKPRPEFLALAETHGAILTGKPDGSEAITVVFTIDAWRAFDAALAAQPAAQEPSNWHKSVRSVVLNYNPAEPAAQEPSLREFVAWIGSENGAAMMATIAGRGEILKRAEALAAHHPSTERAEPQGLKK